MQRLLVVFYGAESLSQVKLLWSWSCTGNMSIQKHLTYKERVAATWKRTISGCRDTHTKKAITNLDELHPLYALCPDGHHGEADGGANNAVSPRDGQFEEGGD